MLLKNYINVINYLTKGVVMKNVLIIIPAYNEENSILNTCKQVLKYKPKNKIKIDLIVINDGSIDKTEEILKNKKIPHINLIKNLGIGGAVQTGYKYAYENNYDYAVQFDGDGQHNINYLENILEPLMNNRSDFVIGSRFINDISSFKSTRARRIGIKIISFLLKIFAHIKITDPTSGFRAANSECIKLFQNNYPKEYPEPESIVILNKLKYKISEVPVEMNERTNGVSSIRAWKNAYYMINVGISIIITSFKKGKDCK